MITQLSIQGLAIIDTLQIDFATGFNVITGETGAGKSILIRALNFLTGGKASPDVVRSGWQAATVSGEFVVPRAHKSVAQLAELGIELEQGPSVTLLLRRQVQSKGRSQAWINDIPVALPSLRVVGHSLLDVFAQHENQKLLNAGDHVDYVDSFLDSPGLREAVRTAGRLCNQTLATLTELLEGALDKQRQSDYLSFRHEELKKFEPSQHDFETIEAYCRQAEGFRKHRDPVAGALALLEGSDGAEPPSGVIREVGKALAGVTEGAALRERVLACARELDDVGFELGRILAGMEFDEQRLEQCQERLYGYQDLFRKHSVRDIEALMTQAQSIAAELGGLSNIEERLEEEVTRLEVAARQLKAAAEKLSVARMQAAQAIKEDVERELEELHMRGSVFQAEFTAVRRELPALPGMAPELARRWEKLQAVLAGVSEHGAEKAQFFLSANPGEPPLPLSRVASGGELSRIMLALKKALAADAETCVLVFDEIDSGISGRVADVMGRKMRELTENFQVICISHLPQVAVYADSHFLVTKKGKGDRTQSSIVPLSKQESAEEIARLLSGRDVSASSLANAKTLIASAKATKKKKTPMRPSAH
jgi:DNA repair protein RecN (Recombination protein N)